jgi:hypothetical protein
MSQQIQDGTGAGYRAKVTEGNRIFTQTISESQADHHSELGDRFNINTGDITLTGNATTSAVLYFKNNEDEDFHITVVVFNLGNSTGGTGDTLIELIRNPSAGTIVSNAVAVSVDSNFNFGSAIDLSATAYKGAEGYTLTDGTVFATTRSASNGRIVLTLGEIVLPKGSSFGIKYTTQASNSSQKVQFAISGFKQTLDT